MIVRKIFSVETGHVVRNCSTDRCKYSQHGHSAKIELFFESRFLDNAGMVIDFGLIKSDIKGFIDALDHCYLFCSAEDDEFRNFHKKYNSRWIELPFIPSAEMLSIFIFRFIDQVIAHTIFGNGEREVSLKGVRYHETETCYAECDKDDAERYLGGNFEDVYKSIIFSKGVTKEFSDSLLAKLSGKPVENKAVEQQIKLH